MALGKRIRPSRFLTVAVGSVLLAGCASSSVQTVKEVSIFKRSCIAGPMDNGHPLQTSEAAFSGSISYAMQEPKAVSSGSTSLDTALYGSQTSVSYAVESRGNFQGELEYGVLSRISAGVRVGVSFGPVAGLKDEYPANMDGSLSEWAFFMRLQTNTKPLQLTLRPDVTVGRVAGVVIQEKSDSTRERFDYVDFFSSLGGDIVLRWQAAPVAALFGGVNTYQRPWGVSEKRTLFRFAVALYAGVDFRLDDFVSISVFGAELIPSSTPKDESPWQLGGKLTLRTGRLFSPEEAKPWTE